MVRSRKEDFACSLVLAAVIAILLHEALFLGKGLLPADSALQVLPWARLFPRHTANVLLSDQYLTFIPLRWFIYEDVHRNGFPLWNPFIFCGAPAVAAIQTASLFPLQLILSFMDPFRSSALAAFLKLWIAGIFTYLYVRRLGTSWAPALLSGLTFSLCGFMIVWLGHPHVNSACLLPALLYALELGLSGKNSKSASRRTLRPWAAFSIAYGCMLLGGHPPTVVHISLWILAYFIFRTADFPNPKAAWASFLLSIATGALLAAPQLLPYLEYYGQSSTPQSTEALARWANRLSPATLTHFFLPHISGNYAEGFEELRWFLGLVPGDNFNERTGYVGILSLVFALGALLTRRDRVTRFYAGMCLLCLCAIYGLPPLPQIFRALPILNGINPKRLMLFICFSLSVLAGLGLQSLDRPRSPAAEQAFLAILWTGSALLLFWLWEIFKPGWSDLSPEEKSFLLRQLPVFLGSIAVASLAILSSKGKQGPMMRWLCLLWAAGDLIWFGKGYNPAIDRTLFYPETKAISWLRNHPGLFRIFGVGWVLPPNTGLLYGLQDIRGQDFTTLRRYEELLTGKAGEFLFYSQALSLPPLLGALNVKYFLTRADWRPPEELSNRYRRVYQDEISIYQTTDFVERALLVPDYEIADAAGILARMRQGNFDPRRGVLLEEQPEAPPQARETNDTPFVRVTAYSPNEVVLEAATPKAAFLLLLDTFYPGWKASINGAPTRIYRADYNFRALRLPPGKSIVHYRYQPSSFYLGLVLAALSLVFLVY